MLILLTTKNNFKWPNPNAGVFAESHSSYRIFLTIVFILFSVSCCASDEVKAQGHEQKTVTNSPTTGPQILLVELSTRLSGLLNKPVAVDRDAPASLYLESDKQPSSLTTTPLPALRHALHEHGLVLFNGEDTALIVLQTRAKHLPLPVLISIEPDRSELEWVTYISDISDVPPKQVYSELRHIIPVYGHMSIDNRARSALVTGPFGSVKRFQAELNRLISSHKP